MDATETFVPNRTRRSPQSAEQRGSLKDDLDGALATITRIEAAAGPTLRAQIDAVDRHRIAYVLDKARTRTIRQRLAHRSGLLKLMRNDFGCHDPQEPTDRARAYVDHILQISANVAVLSGSGWSSVAGWFHRRLPTLADRIGLEAMEANFDKHRAAAAVYLAGRTTSVRSPHHWGPRPATIATELEITTAQLRASGANRCGLTSVDPEDRRTRDRRRKAEARRAAGMQPQSERRTTAELQALAERLGCSLRTVQRHRQAGTLDHFISERGVANLSPVKSVQLVGATSATPPCPANDDDPAAEQRAA